MLDHWATSMFERREGKSIRQVGECLYVKAEKPRKGVQPNGVVHSQRPKLLDRKDLVDQRDCASLAMEPETILRRGKDRVNGEEVGVATTVVFGI